MGSRGEDLGYGLKFDGLSSGFPGMIAGTNLSHLVPSYLLQDDELDAPILEVDGNRLRLLAFTEPRRKTSAYSPP